MNKEHIFQAFKRSTSRLTLFDYLSLVFVAGLIVILALFFFRKTEYLEVEVKVAPADFFWVDKNPPFWLANSLRVGDAEIDSLGRKVAEVLDVRTLEEYGDRKDVYLKLRLLAVWDTRKDQYSFKSKVLGIGSPVELRFSRIFLTGVVTFIHGVRDNRIWEDKVVETQITEWSNVFPETLGIMPWRAEAIQIGDQMKDTQGRVVAEVLEKKVMPAQKVVVTADGTTYVRDDPIKKDVTLVIRLKTFKQNGVNYYLDDYKVKVGSNIPLSLPEIDLSPEITKIIQ